MLQCGLLPTLARVAVRGTRVQRCDDAARGEVRPFSDRWRYNVLLGWRPWFRTHLRWERRRRKGHYAHWYTAPGYKLIHGAKIHVDTPRRDTRWYTAPGHTLIHRAEMHVDTPRRYTRWYTATRYTLIHRARTHVDTPRRDTRWYTTPGHKLIHRTWIHVDTSYLDTRWHTTLGYTLIHHTWIHIDRAQVVTHWYTASVCSRRVQYYKIMSQALQNKASSITL